MSAPLTVAGPYWVRTNTNGTHDLCGRGAKVVRRYPAHQNALASADCRKLQANYSADEKRVRDAAPVLLTALTQELADLNDDIRWAEGSDMERFLARRELMEAAITLRYRGGSPWLRP